MFKEKVKANNQKAIIAIRGAIRKTTPTSASNLKELMRALVLIRNQIMPQKGVDYFTEDEIDQFLNAVRPIKGLHYEDGKDGKDGKNGIGYPGLPGKDGKDADEEVVIKSVLKELSKKKYKISDIEGLKEEIAAVRSKMMRNYGGHGGGLVQSYDMSSLLDGTTKAFTIPQNSFVIQINSSSAPFVFRPTVDYTVGGINNRTLTFASGIDAPSQLATGQTISIIYAK